MTAQCVGWEESLCFW